MIRANSILALFLASVLVGISVPMTFAQVASSTVEFGVNPTLFAAGQASSAFLCVSAKGIAPMALGNGDRFVFSFGSSIGTLTSVSTPLIVNSSTLAPADFSASVNPATHLVTITYNGSTKAFGYGDSICVKVNFTAAASTGSGDVSLISRFTPSINGKSPFVAVSIVDFSAGPVGPQGPKGDTGPQGPGGVRGMQVFGANGTFVVPAGVNAVLIEAWGAGGGGGDTEAPMMPPSGGHCDGTGCAAGGGGGGSYVRTVIPVTAGSTYNIVIGQGGGPGLKVGAMHHNGLDGSDTTFGGTLVVGGGGKGGQNHAPGEQMDGAGGAGGTATLSGASAALSSAAITFDGTSGTDQTSGGDAGGASIGSVSAPPGGSPPSPPAGPPFGAGGVGARVTSISAIIPPTSGRNGFMIVQW